jgi:hypothetical protein
MHEGSKNETLLQRSPVANVFMHVREEAALTLNWSRLRAYGLYRAREIYRIRGAGISSVLWTRLLMHRMSLMKHENPVFFKTGWSGLSKLKFVHRESIVSSRRAGRLILSAMSGTIGEHFYAWCVFSAERHIYLPNRIINLKSRDCDWFPNIEQFSKKLNINPKCADRWLS